MGFLSRSATVTSPARMKAIAVDPLSNFWYEDYPTDWNGQLAAASHISPELALTLSAVFCAVTTIADDIGTMPCVVLENLPNGDKERVEFGRAGIGALAYRLRWRPNRIQTAKEFWSTMVAQYLMRPQAYAELVDGPTGFADQIVPRHPDRVKQEVLPSGRLRFKITEPKGPARYATEDEMMVVRNTSLDGLNGLGRIAYGREALMSGLALQRFTTNYFKKGTTASMVVTRKGGTGDIDEEEDAALHASLSRYASGIENAGGILIVNEDFDIKALGADPEKVQLLGLKDFSVREVARLFRMPGHKLEVSAQTQAYAAREQANLEYLIGCLRPINVTFEQALQRDAILDQVRYFTKFNMDALARPDMKTQGDYFEKAIRSRWMRPSEVRLLLDMNADPDLDRLSEKDFRPGSTAGSSSNNLNGQNAKLGTGQPISASVRSTLLTYEAAQRVLRKEMAAVTKLAERHAKDVDGWQAGLKAFYEDHAGYVSQTLRLPMPAARAYAAQHGALLEAKGVVAMDGWERSEAEELTVLAQSDMNLETAA